MHWRDLYSSLPSYIPYFLKSSIGADNSFNDFEMYKQLFMYRKIDSVLADKALALLDRHGWYLTEQLIPLCLFSNKVNTSTKSLIAAKILSFSPPKNYKLGKPNFQKVNSATELVDLVGENSYLLFHILNVQFNWLNKEPINWEEDEEFNKANKFVRTVKTVNDCAERGVKFITDYATILTKDEKTRDFLLQGVESNRKKYSDFKIKTLNK